MKRTIFLISIVGLFACQPKKAAQKNTAEELKVLLAELTPSRLRGLGLVKNDMSLASFDSALAKTKKQLAALEAMDTSKLKGDDLIDWKFGQSLLAGKEIEQAQMQSWCKDPRLYMTFTGLSALLESPKKI